MKVKIHKTDENYFINEDAKTVACVVELTLENEGKYYPFKASGKAKCSKHDTYDEKVGKRIAYTRAKIKAVCAFIFSDYYKACNQKITNKKQRSDYRCNPPSVGINFIKFCH